MPRTYLAGVLVPLALATTGLVVPTAADAAWSRPGELVKYRVCRDSVDGGDQWAFSSRVRRYYRSPDARAAITVRSGRRQVATWRSGWLDRGEVQVSTVRVTKAPQVRVFVQMEAGDRDSEVGTTAEGIMLRPAKIRHCG